MVLAILQLSFSASNMLFINIENLLLTRAWTDCLGVNCRYNYVLAETLCKWAFIAEMWHQCIHWWPFSVECVPPTLVHRDFPHMACVESNGETAPSLKMCDTFVSITSPVLVYSHYILKMATIELVTDVKGQGSTNMIQLPSSFGSQLMCSTFVSDSSKVGV